MSRELTVLTYLGTTNGRRGIRGNEIDAVQSTKETKS